MDKPSEAELETWIEECVANLRDRQDFAVLRAHANEFLLLFGPIARTTRFADAYLNLARSGYGNEAVPLARAALEHAVTAQWVFIVDGAVDRFRVETAYDQREHYATLASWLNNDELSAAVAGLDPPPSGKRMPPFLNMLRELDKERFLETSYHIFSQQVHVTHAAVSSFLEQDEQQTHVKYEQEYPYHYQATYGVAAACMLVRWILARLTNDTALLDVLDKKSDTLILPMNLIDSVPPARRRAGVEA